MEQVAGFYDPFAAKLYIADWLPLEMQRPALAHEIEHALQDQHFDLKKFATPIKDDGDRQLGHSALVEGDAHRGDARVPGAGDGPAARPDGRAHRADGQAAPLGQLRHTRRSSTRRRAFVRETLMFPYLTGLLFVESVRRSQPWSKIDEIFKTPPESTEQVMHPEKYAAHEHPAKITPAPLPSLGTRKEVRRDVFGELVMKILFTTAPTPPAPPRRPRKKGATPAPPADDAATLAEKAAAGWGGDREVAYAEPGARRRRHRRRPVDVGHRGRRQGGRGRSAQRLMEKLAAADARHDDWLVAREGDKLVLVFGAPKGTGARSPPTTRLEVRGRRAVATRRLVADQVAHHLRQPADVVDVLIEERHRHHRRLARRALAQALHLAGVDLRQRLELLVRAIEVARHLHDVVGRVAAQLRPRLQAWRSPPRVRAATAPRDARGSRRTRRAASSTSPSRS